MTKYESLPDNITPYAKTLCDECEKLDAEKDSDKIISVLEKAFADSPESYMVMLGLAVAYRKSGSFGRSIKILENATKIYPDNINILHELANSYAERKWNKKALTQYINCIRNHTLSPGLIQDFSEFCMEIHENDILNDQLLNILENTDKFSDTDIPAMCFAMLYSNASEYMAINKETIINTDYFDTYVKNHSYLISADFFIDIMLYLAESPNEPEILSIVNCMIDVTMQKQIPQITTHTEFLAARANLEVSNILFNNDVNTLTIFAIRTVKRKFDCDSANCDELDFLIFKGKIDLINSVRINATDVNTFKIKYIYLWSLISDEVTKMITASDLKKHTEDMICSFLINASTELIAIAEQNIPQKEFMAFRSILKKRQNPQKTITGKVPPNAPCPCGSGKKYKKCCGLLKR